METVVEVVAFGLVACACLFWTAVAVAILE